MMRNPLRASPETKRADDMVAGQDGMELLRRIRMPSKVNAVTFSAGGSLLATAGDDGNVLLWEPNQGQLLRTCRGHTKAVTSIAFSPGGSLMASGSHDTTVIIWDPRNGTCSFTLTEHTVWIPGAAWHVLCGVCLLSVVHFVQRSCLLFPWHTACVQSFAACAYARVCARLQQLQLVGADFLVPAR